ncbi:MAG: hypothetical protein JW867_04205 [Candidatus Omnitrophica bacterium]|nr:hypothetical protein [Candidatus Omnitrophota bacterium]
MKKKPKKSYKMPQIETRQIYEVNALGCAKCPSASNKALNEACIRGTKKFS